MLYHHQLRRPMTMRFRAVSSLLVCGMAFVLAPVVAQAQVSEENLANITTVVVIYAENRSFDHLYGFFPGANGIAQATPEQKIQLDHDGTALPYLTVFDKGKPDPRFPQLANHPFAIERDPRHMAPAQLLA